MTQHVFVETNFVVDWAAPAHHRAAAAVALVERAERGELVLHLPAVCLLEARSVLRGGRFQPRDDADPIRAFIGLGSTSPEEKRVVLQSLDRYEAYIKRELTDAPARVESLRQRSGIDVFAADDLVLVRSIELTGEVEGTKPFDLAVLAAVLVRAERIRAGDPSAQISFCELDADLQPWDRKGASRAWLQALYDASHVWVYADFTMVGPPRPPSWPTVL